MFENFIFLNFSEQTPVKHWNYNDFSGFDFCSKNSEHDVEYEHG